MANDWNLSEEGDLLSKRYVLTSKSLDLKLLLSNNKDKAELLLAALRVCGENRMEVGRV